METKVIDGKVIIDTYPTTERSYIFVGANRLEELFEEYKDKNIRITISVACGDAKPHLPQP